MAASTIYGRSMQEARRIFASAPLQFTANTTVTRHIVGLPVGSGPHRIVSIGVICSTVPLDADGALTLTVRNRDASENATDTIVNAQDLEALVTAAEKVFACTLVTEDSEKQLTIEAQDAIDFQLISNSAAIDANPFVVVILELIPLPDASEQSASGFVKHPSQY